MHLEAPRPAKEGSGLSVSTPEMGAGGTGPEFQKQELNLAPCFHCYMKSRGLVTFPRPCRRRGPALRPTRPHCPWAQAED